jgi:phosphoglycolate phosphatase
MPNQIRGVFFDLDGTLIDSKKEITESVNDIRKDLALPRLTEEEVIPHVGRGTTTLLKAVVPETVNFETVYPRFLEYYRANSLKYARFYEGVPELLTGLKNFKTALITNKAYSVSSEIVRKFKLEDYFALVYGGDTFKERKPDPFPLDQAARELGLSKGEIIYFGDSPPDYLASQAAGIFCVMATYGFGTPVELAACRNALLIDSPRELLVIIEKLKNQSWESLLKR